MCEFPARIAGRISVLSEPGGDEVRQRRDHIENQHEQRPVDSVGAKHTNTHIIRKKKSRLLGHEVHRQALDDAPELLQRTAQQQKGQSEGTAEGQTDQS